jgi:Tfp pilus assembly protein PilO
MMKFKLANIIPRRAPSFKIVFFALLLVLVTAGIVIEYMSLVSLDKKADKIRLEVEEQKGLQSIYQLLKSKGKKIARELPSPTKGKISRNQIETMPGVFRRIAQKVNMDVLYASPDISSVGPDSKYLLVSVGVRGDFYDFRKFLIGIGDLPYLDQIEEIQIQENADIMEFKMKIRLMMA